MAGNKIFITLEVDDKGTAVMKQFGGNTDKAFDKLKKNAKAGATQAGKMEQAWAKSIKGLQQHWKAYAAVAGVAMTGVAVAAIAVAKKAISSFADFEKEMANVSTLVDTSKVSMKGLEKGIMGISPALGSATELTKGLYQALSAGVKPAESIAFVGKAAMAAKAGLSDTFTAVDAGTTILNAFGMQASRAGEVYDLMFTTVKEGKTTFAELASAVGKISPIASAANVSVVEMHAALATLTKGGFATTEASSRLATALGTIIKPSSEAAKMSEKLGLQFNAQALKAKGLHGFLQDVKKATGGNVEQMAQLFGGMESLSVILALTGKQSQEFTDILGRMKNASGATEEAFEKQKVTLIALWDTFKNTIEKIAIKIGAELSPAIKEWIVNLETMIEQNPKVVDQVAEFAKNVLGLVTVMGKVVSLGVQFINVFADTYRAMGLASSGIITWKEALLEGTAAVEQFNKAGTGLKVLKDIEALEKKLTRTMKYRQMAEKKGNSISIKIYNERIGRYEKELGVLKEKAGIETTNIAKISALEKAKNKELLAYMDDLIEAQVKTEKKIVDVHVKGTKTYLSTEQIKNKNLLAYMDDLLKEHSATSKEKIKITEKETKAIADYAKESTKIYERMYDDVQKLDLGDYAYNLQLLAKRYTNYKDHLESLAKQDSKYAGGVQLLDKWLAGEKEKLWNDWARKHGTVLERMAVRWKDYQKEAIDANSIAYNAISAGAAEMQKQLSDVFFNVVTGQMGKVKLDWDAMWKSMVRSTTDHMARIVAETALNTATKAAGAGMDWLGTAMGWWAAGSWEIKKQHMAMLHPGEMVIPADMAERVRASSAGGSNIGLGEPMAPEASITIPGSFRDIYTDNAMKAALLSAAKGFGIKTAINFLTGIGLQVNPLGVIGTFARAGLAGYMGTRDAKQLYSLIYGKDAPYNPDQNVQAAMRSLDWSNFDADMASKYGMMAMNHPGYGRGYSVGEGGSGSFGDTGGTGYGGGYSGTTGMGMGDYGGSGDFGGFRRGGLAKRASIFGEHGPEWAVPTYEPERSRFLKDVGADPDKLAAAIANKIGGRSGGGDIHITVEVGGEEFDTRIERVSDNVRVKAERRQLGTQRMYN